MGTKRTGARRDHRLPTSLSDEQIAEIADEGKIPKARRPLLASHLRALLAAPKNNEYAMTREVKALYKQTSHALKINTAAEFHKLALDLRNLSPALRKELTRLAAIHDSKLPAPSDLANYPISMETWKRIALLNGLTSPPRPADRDRGPPIDHTVRIMNSRLQLIYAIVAGGPSAIKLGRGNVHSPFQCFVAATLLHLGWRSPEAEGPPKQAREAKEAMEAATRRRLLPEGNDEKDFPDYP